MSSFPLRSSLSAALALLCVACGDPVEPSVDAATSSADAASVDAFSTDDSPTTLDAMSLTDSPTTADGPTTLDAPAERDAHASDDASALADAFSVDDAPVTRRSLIADFCPSTVTSAGLYRGTLASNLNDIAGACTVTAPGRDGSVRVMLAPGQSLTATYRHAGDGIVYLLERCPVVASCVASADASSSGAETLRYTNSGSAAAPYYLVLDSDSTGDPQTFELDLEITP